jgi:stringent starvation protein B
VSDADDKLSRMQAVLTALLKHQLSSSLGEVENALERWRAGEFGPFEAHAELLKHQARSERMASRIAQVQPDKATSVMRDAFDAGLIGNDEFVDLVGVAPDEIEPSPPLDEETDVPSLPDKREFVTELLNEGPVLVHIDARHDDVSVPDRFRSDPKLVLRFGYGLSPAIADMCVDDVGISGTLTFGGIPHHCVIAWQALYAVVAEADQRGMVWPDDVPEVVLDQMSTRSDEVPERPAAQCAPKRQSPKRRASHLKLVD